MQDASVVSSGQRIIGQVLGISVILQHASTDSPISFEPHGPGTDSARLYSAGEQ